jgi:hypothetical protein
MLEFMDDLFKYKVEFDELFIAIVTTSWLEFILNPKYRVFLSNFQVCNLSFLSNAFQVDYLNTPNRRLE